MRKLFALLLIAVLICPCSFALTVSGVNEFPIVDEP